MTQFQESISARRSASSGRAFTAPFLAITAGLVVLLMALAVASFALADRPADTGMQASTNAAAVDGWMPAAIAFGSQHRIEAAQQLRDGWAASVAPPRRSTATDGWEAGLVQPHEPAVDGYTQRFLIDD